MTSDHDSPRSETADPLRRAAAQFNTAVQRMLNREPREAAQIVERELCRTVFGDEHANPEAVDGHEASRADWRAAIFSVLATALESVKSETWNEWVERVKGAVRKAALSLGWVENKDALRSYMKCNQDGLEQRIPLLEVAVTSLWAPEDTVTTIHKVKGAEFDTVVLFARKPHKTHAPCPSTEWWSEEDGTEERRIAFVAISRAKHHFILCIHRATHDALKTARPEFLELFSETISLPIQTGEDQVAWVRFLLLKEKILLSSNCGRFLQGCFRILEILYDEREAPIPQQVGIADEKEFYLKFDRFSELLAFQSAGADNIAFSPHTDGFVGFSGTVNKFFGCRGCRFW